jgi:hypothetical protein
MRHSSRRTFLTVEECDGIRIRELVAAGVFAAKNAPFGTLSWTANAVAAQPYKLVRIQEKMFFLLVPVPRSSTKQAQYIEITRSPCNYGGFRSWLRCLGLPGRRCGRRVTALFRPPEEALFACRTCHCLTYQSVQKHDKRVDRIARDSCLIVDLLQGRNLRHRLLALAAASKLRSRSQTKA